MQEKIEKGIGWLQKLLHLQEKFGFFSILKSLFILLITGYVVFFALNPRYLLDKNGTGANRATQRRCITPYECRCKYTDDI